MQQLRRTVPARNTTIRGLICVLVAFSLWSGIGLLRTTAFKPLRFARTGLVETSPGQFPKDSFLPDPTVARHSFVSCKRQSSAPMSNVLRVCHFTNVCWNPNASAFVYWQAPDQLPVAVLYDGATNWHVEELRVPLQTTAWETGLPPTASGTMAVLPIVLVSGSIPDGSRFHDTAAVHVLFAPALHPNDGITLGMDLLPVVALQRIFGFSPDEEPQILVPQVLQQHMNEFERLRQLAKFVSRHPIRALMSDAVAGGFREHELTCVRNLLVGHARTGILYDHDNHYTPFVDKVQDMAARQSSAVPTAATAEPDHLTLRVAIAESGGVRGDVFISNADDVAAHLAAHLGVTVTTYSPYPHTFSYAKQAALAQQTAVLIMPCEIMSFFSTFLRPGSVVILVGDRSDRSAGGCGSEEMTTWSWNQVVTEAYCDTVRVVELAGASTPPLSGKSTSTTVKYTLDKANITNLVTSALYTFRHTVGVDSDEL